MIWSLTVELDPDPLDQTSTYLDKKRVKICSVLTSGMGSMSVRGGQHLCPRQWHDAVGYVYIVVGLVPLAFVWSLVSGVHLLACFAKENQY